MALGYIDVAPDFLDAFLAALPPTIKIVGTMSSNVFAVPSCRFSIDVVGHAAPWGRWTCEISTTLTAKTFAFKPPQGVWSADLPNEPEFAGGNRGEG
jgi:hypothetical protein